MSLLHVQARLSADNIERGSLALKSHLERSSEAAPLEAALLDDDGFSSHTVDIAGEGRANPERSRGAKQAREPRTTAAKR